MPIHNLLARVAQSRLMAPIRQAREAMRLRQFRALTRATADAGAMGVMDAAGLAGLLQSALHRAAWEEDSRILVTLDLPELTGGVNPGDQRALHALMLGLKPSTVLEVGTHIGCSTVSLALAGRRVGSRITTCDIWDVNDANRCPWRKYGSDHSPQQLLELAGCAQLVAFRVGDSLAQFRESAARYDLIFLDGDHSAVTVYQELPLALKALTPGGYVLLHDFYPENRPLWDGDPPLPGPFLAVERLLAEGAGFQVLPLGALPWPTRSGSNLTSLALVARSV